MTSRPFVRDLCLLAFAATLGWWARGANSAVHADTASPSEGLAFQFGGLSHDAALTIYQTANRTLYVYPSALNSSHINCAYSFYIEKPGASIEHSNCPAGSATSR